jgi:hypothetical protein
MARIRRKKALYEVISRKSSKMGQNPAVGPLRPEEAVEPQQLKADNKQKSARTVISWPTKPKMLQFHAGRMEISLPVQLAVAVVLGIVLLALVFFRLGQLSYSASMKPSPLASDNAPSQPPVRPDVAEKTKTPGTPADRNMAPATANNAIVLVEHDRYADLSPVQQHFAGFGVATQIVTRGAKYFLVTTKRYESFAPNTQGDNDLKRIKEIGAKYKAPPGRETFAAHLFSDAYGSKVWY